MTRLIERFQEAYCAFLTASGAKGLSARVETARPKLRPELPAEEQPGQDELGKNYVDAAATAEAKRSRCQREAVRC